MKKIALAIALFCLTSAHAKLLELETADQFKELIANSTVPVMVQFSAYWCGPCKDLKATLTKVANDYTDDKVIIAYVDAYVNTSLKSYLQGGYPTVRTFRKNELTTPAFVGSKSESYVRTFIEGLVNGERDEFCPL